MTSRRQARRQEAVGTQQQAVVVHNDRGSISVRCDQLPLPPLGADELRIRPTYVGICGSDLEQIFGELDPSFRVTFPHVLGHEWSGVVAEAGPETSRFRPGDRAIGHGALGGNRWFGVSCDGAMAETFCVPEDVCFPVPEDVSLLRAALIEPLACSLQALRVAGGTDPGQMLAVVGCGALGLSMVALGSVIGASVVAVDRSEHRLGIAQRLGADFVQVAAENQPAEAVRACLAVDGVDLSVEASGAPGAQALAIELAGWGGRVMFMGLGHLHADRVPLHRIQARGLRLMSSTGAPPEIWEPALLLVSRTGMDLSPIVSDVFAFEDCVQAVAAARDAQQHSKVVMSPSGGHHEF